MNGEETTACVAMVNFMDWFDHNVILSDQETNTLQGKSYTPDETAVLQSRLAAAADQIDHLHQELENAASRHYAQQEELTAKDRLIVELMASLALAQRQYEDARRMGQQLSCRVRSGAQ